MSTEFDQYIGTKVLVDEEIRTIKLFGEEEKYPHYKINNNDTVVSNIKGLYKGQVRVWLPDSMGTMDVKRDRLNIVITKDGDAFQIARIYFG